jgi:hypothetical protein
VRFKAADQDLGDDDDFCRCHGISFLNFTDGVFCDIALSFAFRLVMIAALGPARL